MIRYLKTVALALGSLGACGAFSAGCGGGSSGHSFIAPVNSGTSWDSLYMQNPPVQGDAVSAIMSVHSGLVLVGETSGGIYSIDTNGVATLEGTFGGTTTISLTTTGSILAATGPDLNGQNGGQVLERTPSGWEISLDHPSERLTLATLGNDVLAVASAAPMNSDATVSRLERNGWNQDLVALGAVAVGAAVEHQGELWIGGWKTDQSGEAVLLHGTIGNGNGNNQTNFAETTLPNIPGANEQLVVSALLSVNGTLYVSVYGFDLSNANVVNGGEVLSSDDGGQTFTSLQAYIGDSPRALAWHQDRLFVGLSSGILQARAATGELIADSPPILPNLGVHVVASRSPETLLAGVQGLAGAEVMRRITLTQAPPATTSPGSGNGNGNGNGNPNPVPVLSYQANVKSVVLNNCAVCHADPNNVAFGEMELSAGLADDNADYAALLGRVNVGNPTNSILIRKASDERGQPHGGGVILPEGSAELQLIQDWIAAGAAF